MQKKLKTLGAGVGKIGSTDSIVNGNKDVMEKDKVWLEQKDLEIRAEMGKKEAAANLMKDRITDIDKMIINGEKTEKEFKEKFTEI